MATSVEAVVRYAERAVDEMARIIGDLGDDLANRRPGFPGANSPYAIVRHTVGVMDFWGGQVVAGRQPQAGPPAAGTGVPGIIITACREGSFRDGARTPRRLARCRRAAGTGYRARAPGPGL